MKEINFSIESVELLTKLLTTISPSIPGNVVYSLLTSVLNTNGLTEQSARYIGKTIRRMIQSNTNSPPNAGDL